MVKRAFVISACLIAIIVIVSIIISLKGLNLKPLEFKSVVSYENNITVMKAAPVYTGASITNSGLPFLSNLMKLQRITVIGAFIIIFIFTLLFYGAKGSKS